MNSFFLRFFISLTTVFPFMIQTVNGQAITILAPSSSIAGKKIDVVIRGINTHFKSGVSRAVVAGGNDIEVRALSVQDPLTAIVTLDISPSASRGFRTLMVITNSETARIENGFEVFDSNSSLRVNIQALPVGSIEISDFDFSNVEASPIFFFSNVFNDNVRREVKIFVFFSGAAVGLIGYVSTAEKQLEPNQYYKLTNKDFGRFVSNGDNGNAIMKAIREKGGLPPDEYTYRIEIRDLNGRILASDETITTINNPRSNPELITPGSIFADNIETVYSPQPLFQWFGNTNKYDFNLYFYKEGQTPEEVVRSLPVFTQQDLTSTSFLYPNYAEKLIEGRVYAWQVKGKYPGSKGTQFLPSQVFRFVYGGPAGGLAVTKINITPLEIELKPGEKLQFHAELLDNDNNLVTSMQPTWQITPANGTITSNGLFTAGNEPTNVAVLVKVGPISDFAVVSIKPTANIFGNYDEWLIEKMIRRIFGIPPK